MTNLGEGRSSLRGGAWSALLVALAGLAGTAIPGDAHACGGLFCNGPPPDPFAPLPVAQNGENVVFAITKDPAGGASTLEAHIQILYTGDAAKFSWVVPVDAEPTLSTGTDQLFTALATATQPVYQTSYETSGDCIPELRGNTDNAGIVGAAGTSGSVATTGAAGTGSAGPSVQVSFQGAVGPFEAAVIKSDDPTALKKWLTDNAYVVTDAAGALIDVYVRENKFFVALKLLNGVGVRQIQPIVLTFKGAEACVPLRLTAIAANPNMPVLVWVLGSKRVAPRAYYELQIDEARVDWQNGGTNYFGPQGLVSKAADEAGGNAFVTEYAGPASVARQMVFNGGLIDLEALGKAMTPPVYVQLLVQMGLASDPLTLPLLAKYIPMPDTLKAMGVTDSQFYGNLQTYWGTLAFPPFDLVGLTAEISTSIVMPRMKAQMMLDSHTYLTRLNTFISPAEMTKDPFFFETQDLPELSNVHTATIRTLCGRQQYMACNAPQRLELADGRRLWLRAGTSKASCVYPPTDLTDLQNLPASQVVWSREVVGTGTVVSDNSTAIMAGIAAHNARFPAEESMFNGGCGCGIGDGSNNAPLFVALGAALVVVIARRRRARGDRN